MYAAQLLHSLQQEIDVENVLASDDYSPIKTGCQSISINMVHLENQIN